MIKRLLISATVLLVSFSSSVNAQCIPDPTITTPGIYPDSATGLVSGIVGVPYIQDVQAKVPVDTIVPGIPFPVTITNITLTSVTGLPPGLTYSCTPSSCVFPGGSNGCMLISGTPTTAGLYPLVVELEANGTIFGTPVPAQTSTLTYYSIFIDVNSSLNSDLSSLQFGVVATVPNPAANFTDISFTTPVGGEFAIRLVNMIGEVVYTQQISGVTGHNTARVDLNDLAAGVYLVSIDNGTTAVNSRLIVTGI